jgi:hypothetical protein
VVAGETCREQVHLLDTPGEIASAPGSIEGEIGLEAFRQISTPDRERE